MAEGTADDKILHEDQVREVIRDEIGEPGASIANASTAHALNSTFSDTEVEAALNALGTKLNAVIARLVDKQLIEDNG